MTPSTQQFIDILKTQHASSVREMAKATTTSYLHSLQGSCIAIQAVLTDMCFDLDDITPEDRDVLHRLEQELHVEERQHADRAFDRLIELNKHKFNINRGATNDAA